MLGQVDEIDFFDALVVHLYFWGNGSASKRNEDDFANLDCMSLKMDQQVAFHNYSVHLLTQYSIQGNQMWKDTFVLYGQDLLKQSMFHFELD